MAKKYEAPKVVRINDLSLGHGAHCGPGSGAGDCQPGNSAADVCAIVGNGATAFCTSGNGF